MTDTRCLAQKAMDVFEDEGEAQMLEFVRSNLDSRPTGQEKIHKALMILNDHSAMMAQSDRYFFLWTPSEEESKHPMAATRARNLQKQELPASPCRKPAQQAPETDQ